MVLCGTGVVPHLKAIKIKRLSTFFLKCGTVVPNHLGYIFILKSVQNLDSKGMYLILFNTVNNPSKSGTTVPHFNKNR